MVVHETRTAQGVETTAASLPNYLSWEERVRTLELAAYSRAALTWTGAEQPERLEALATTASFLSVIGGSLHTGRWFSADEVRPGQPRVAVLSNRLWRTRFGGDPDILGRQLILNGTPSTVIGVASAAFSVPLEPDLWIPHGVDPATARRMTGYLAVLGRLKPGFTRDQAQAEMSSIARALEQEFPDSNKDSGISLTPLARSLVPAEIRTALVVLLAAASMVVLIACANVANVLLTRAADRRREVAIRTALGAGAARITRQLLTESVLLSATGAALGLLLSSAIVNTARHALVDIVPRVEEVRLNITVFGFALGLAIVTGLSFGLAPLWHVSRMGASALFQATGRGNLTPSRNRVRAVLVVGQSRSRPCCWSAQASSSRVWCGCSTCPPV